MTGNSKDPNEDEPNKLGKNQIVDENEAESFANIEPDGADSAANIEPDTK